MSLNKIEKAWMCLNQSKWVLLNLNELKCVQKSLNKSKSKCAKMCLNKLKGASISLN